MCLTTNELRTATEIEDAVKIAASANAFSYIDNAGRLEGLFHDGSYVPPALLPGGIDFDGNGAEEQICLARHAVIKVTVPKTSASSSPTARSSFLRCITSASCPSRPGTSVWTARW